MNKPVPAHSRVRDIIAETITMPSSMDELEKLKHQGPLLFTEQDIYATSWPLDQVLRELCVRNSITEAYFTERYKLYALQVLGKHPTQASNDRSNAVKALKLGHITYKRLIEIAENVLGLKIMNMKFVFSDNKGDTQSLEFNKENNTQV